MEAFKDLKGQGYTFWVNTIFGIYPITKIMVEVEIYEIEKWYKEGAHEPFTVERRLIHSFTYAIKPCGNLACTEDTSYWCYSENYSVEREHKRVVFFHPIICDNDAPIFQIWDNDTRVVEYETKRIDDEVLDVS